MSRSLPYLRRVVFGIACAASLGFGATQAFADLTGTPWYKTCPATGEDYPLSRCAYGCEVPRGYCTADGRCACGDLP